jgi:branched-subunit amino acid aminotransferase/4-amino-4-deoxychorismate lyase
VYERGYRAGIAGVRRCADSAVAGIKSNNYLVTVLARREAAVMGLDESVLLNDKGFIAEGGNSNIFFVRKGVLVTPALESGILPGITRQLVMDTAAELKINVAEEDILLESLSDFDEAFMTSAVIEVMPLLRLSGPPREQPSATVNPAQ